MEDNREVQQDKGEEENEHLYGNSQEPEDDKPFIEDESQADSQVTINDINPIEHANKAQINMDPEIGEEVTDDCPESPNIPTIGKT